MKAEIITIGDEILIGQIVDTNSQWIGQELNKIGVSIYQISSIQDEEGHILKALKEAEERVDIVIITGGLGPTKDDITKKTLATYFKDDKLTVYPEVIAHISDIFKRLDKPVNEVQQYQAELPSTATLLFNNFGTAPGMWFSHNDTIFVSLPGVPYEMKGLITREVLPRIQEQFSLPFIQHVTINTYGVGESYIAEELAFFEDALPDFIKLAYLPAAGKVRLRLSGKHTNKVVLESKMNTLVSEVQALIPNIIAGVGEENDLAKQIGELLKDRKQNMCTAESMTGGKISATLISVPGASSYFMGSFVTYSSELKEELLEVPKSVIEKCSAVSKEVAEIMATNARKKMHVDYAVSVTGNAGPTTDLNNDNLGVVYIGISSITGTSVYQFDFGQPREKVIDRTINKALELLQEKIIEN